MTDICHGKPIAYIGHKVSCPKCKGTYPIVEGAQTTSFYGKGVALAGMRTACGAVLIATQFTDTVEWSSGPVAARAAARSSAPMPPAKTGAVAPAAGDRETSWDEQSVLPAQVADGIPYLIVTPDGRKLSGRADANGHLPRIATEGEADYAVYWGDEALARMEA